MSTKRAIKYEIKKYIAEEQRDMYTYEDKTITDLKETEAIIKALTDEKLDIIIADVNWEQDPLCDIICDIFENILYRISKKEYAFLFNNENWVNE